jgi:hypothetical protein
VVAEAAARDAASRDRFPVQPTRRYAVTQAIRPAMLALRDAEDFARLTLYDAALADRIRGIHESLTDDVLNGRTSKLSDRWKAKLWDRYCLLRGHDPDAGARARSRFLRRISGRRVAA